MFVLNQRWYLSNYYCYYWSSKVMLLLPAIIIYIYIQLSAYIYIYINFWIVVYKYIYIYVYTHIYIYISIWGTSSSSIIIKLYRPWDPAAPRRRRGRLCLQDLRGTFESSDFADAGRCSPVGRRRFWEFSIKKHGDFSLTWLGLYIYIYTHN